jgi:hypothetical protein
MKIHTLVAGKGSRDDDTLSADGNDVLAGQKLLGDGGSQTAQKVATAINNDPL